MEINNKEYIKLKDNGMLKDYIIIIQEEPLNTMDYQKMEIIHILLKPVLIHTIR